MVVFALGVGGTRSNCGGCLLHPAAAPVAAESPGQSRGHDLVLQGPQVSCLLSVGVCRAGFSSPITAFAFLVFSVSWWPWQ